MNYFSLQICYAIGEKTEFKQTNENIVHHHDSTTPHMDHSVLVFFTPNELKIGNKIQVYFKKITPSSNTPHFLPKEEANLIPFSHSNLSFLIQLFGFPKSSSQAQAMEDTLKQCEMSPIKGETKFCAASLESMLDFVHQIFGLNTQFKALSTKNSGLLDNILQNYTIMNEPKEVLAPKMVACHTMPYPYVVYYCHYQVSESKVFKVTLMGENGDGVEAVAVCHMDTSQWSSNHVSFRVLGIMPGSSPVCHFFPADNLVWVPLNDGDEGFGDDGLSSVV